MCAFSPTSYITQRDGWMGCGRAGQPHPPAPVPGPGSPGVSMHPADIPAIREPILEPQRHPGVLAGVLAHPLRRDPRPASPPRATCTRAAGMTQGDASTTAIRTTLSATEYGLHAWLRYSQLSDTCTFGRIVTFPTDFGLERRRCHSSRCAGVSVETANARDHIHGSQ